jgi:hypothetical protein
MQDEPDVKIDLESDEEPQRSPFSHFTGFFQKIAQNAPKTLETNFRIFEQRLRDTFSGREFQLEQNPQVTEAIFALNHLAEFYDKLHNSLQKQARAIASTLEAEDALSLIYNEAGVQLRNSDLAEQFLFMGRLYHDVRHKETKEVLTVLVNFLDNVAIFREKAILDSVETMRQQEQARGELDGYAGKSFSYSNDLTLCRQVLRHAAECQAEIQSRCR